MSYPNQFWNEKYAEETFVYGTNPNVWLEENLPTLTKGSILFPAEGEGRNAVYAAKSGWEVTAFDFSKEGKKKAMLLAQQNQVDLDYHIASADEVNFERTFNSICFSFSHFPAAIKIGAYQHLEQFLEKGGTVILELFAKEQAQYQEISNSGGPRDMAMLWSKEEVLQALPNIEWQSLEVVVYHLNEGPGHQGEGAVIRGIGVKK